MSISASTVFCWLIVLAPVRQANAICFNGGVVNVNAQPPICVCKDGFRGLFCEEAFFCPSPFETRGDRCLQLLSFPASTFAAATSNCKAAGGVPALVGNYKDNSPVQGYLRGKAPQQPVWVELIDATMGTATQTGGSVAQYAPTWNGSTLNGCYEMAPPGYSVTASSSCDESRIVVCEWRPSNLSPGKRNGRGNGRQPNTGASTKLFKAMLVVALLIADLL